MLQLGVDRALGRKTATSRAKHDQEFPFEGTTFEEVPFID